MRTISGQLKNLYWRKNGCKIHLSVQKLIYEEDIISFLSECTWRSTVELWYIAIICDTYYAVFKLTETETDTETDKEWLLQNSMAPRQQCHWVL